MSSGGLKFLIDYIEYTQIVDSRTSISFAARERTKKNNKAARASLNTKKQQNTKSNQSTFINYSKKGLG